MDATPIRMPYIQRRRAGMRRRVAIESAVAFWSCTFVGV
jgi:hypothetical protein